MSRALNPAEIPLALYAHIPWCVRKCPYCDFNSHAADSELPEDDYITALLTDLDAELRLAAGRPLVSIFIGGGTPSLVSPAAIGRLLDGIAERCRLAPELEVTLEANPGTVEQERFEGFRAAGVNRLSIGIQSFDADMLSRLGRIHGPDEAIAAAEAARAAGFDNFNLDLMYALPGQTPAAALADLQQAIDLAPTHLSHYQLTLEPGTEFGRHPPRLPDDDDAWEMMVRGRELLQPAGYARYEISAWAQPDRQCRHNLNYWQFGDYIGIGAGAHGKLSTPDGIWRRRKATNPARYLRGAASGEALQEHRPLRAAELPFEFMLNALRLHSGFSRELFEQRTGLAWARLGKPLDELVETGLLRQDDTHVATSERGQLFLNDVLSAFLPEETRHA